MRVAATLSAMAAASATAVLACEGPDLGFPWDFERMLEQPRYEAYAASDFFDDGRVMRTPPRGTVPYDASAFEDGVDGRRQPPSTDLALLERGRDRYSIYCSPCHGESGHADTPVAERMSLRPPPSLHEKRLRALDRAALHRVVHEGYGLMPGYGKALSWRDEWAVAAYVQALQRSQHAPFRELTGRLRDSVRRSLEEEGS